MSTKQTVSLCMIVRDEEGCLPAAIQSVRDFIDELIIIDTGSTDNTPQLALSLGANLFYFAWTHDFSEARNFALQQATCDWILVLDADEILEAIEPQTFYELLNNIQVEGYYIRIKNKLNQNSGESYDQVVRLFRNKPAYQFEGAIHEQIAPCILRINNGGGLSLAPLTLSHSGYLKDRLDLKDKFNRNSTIIQQELLKNPSNPFLHYCLGIEYYQQNFIDKGLPHLEKALVHMSGHEGYYEDILLYIALGYLHLEETAKTIDFIKKVLKMYPNQAAFLFLRGTAYFYQMNYSLAAVDFNHLLQIFMNRIACNYESDNEKTIASFLILAIKEIQQCCVIIENSNMEPIHSKTILKLNRTLNESLPLLGKSLFSNLNSHSLSRGDCDQYKQLFYSK